VMLVSQVIRLTRSVLHKGLSSRTQLLSAYSLSRSSNTTG